MKTLVHTSFILISLSCLIQYTGALSQEIPDSEMPSYVRLRASIIALENVRIIDGTGTPPIEMQTVVIEHGRITQVRAVNDAIVPDSAIRIDLSGRTVLPGLVMLHEHMMYFSGRAVWHPQPVSYPSLYLAAGVTTVRTAGGDFPFIDLNLRARIENGDAPGPRMHVTGPFFNGEDGGFLGDVIVRNEEDARKEVRYWAAKGVTSFKVYSELSREAMKGVIEEAHGLGLSVTGHLGQIGCREAADLGIDNIEHSFGSCSSDLNGSDSDEEHGINPDDPNTQELIRHLVASGVALTATPMAIDRRISDEELAMLHPEPRARYLTMMSNGPPWEVSPANERKIRLLELAFVNAGGRLVLGADAADYGQIAGYANIRVLELMVEAGFTPLEVIRMATMEGAKFLGVDDQLGSVTEGKVADLIVVEGNPALRMSDMGKIELVFKAGVAYDPLVLRESVRGIVGWH